MKRAEILELKKIHDKIVNLELILNQIKSQHLVNIGFVDYMITIYENDDYIFFYELRDLIENKLKQIKLKYFIED